VLHEWAHRLGACVRGELCRLSFAVIRHCIRKMYFDYKVFCIHKMSCFLLGSTHSNQRRQDDAQDHCSVNFLMTSEVLPHMLAVESVFVKQQHMRVCLLLSFGVF